MRQKKRKDTGTGNCCKSAMIPKLPAQASLLSSSLVPITLDGSTWMSHRHPRTISLRPPPLQGWHLHSHCEPDRSLVVMVTGDTALTPHHPVSHQVLDASCRVPLSSASVLPHDPTQTISGRDYWKTLILRTVSSHCASDKSLSL